MSTGGIAIPQRAQRAEEWGTVENHGDKCENLTTGDRVYIAAHLGTHYIEDGRDFILIDEQKIIAKLED